MFVLGSNVATVPLGTSPSILATSIFVVPMLSAKALATDLTRLFLDTRLNSFNADCMSPLCINFSTESGTSISNEVSVSGSICLSSLFLASASCFLYFSATSFICSVVAVSKNFLTPLTN